MSEQTRQSSSLPPAEGPELVATPIGPLPIGHDCRLAWRLRARAHGTFPYGGRDFEIWACSECGLGYTDPVPAEADSPALYQARSSRDFLPSDSRLLAWIKDWLARRDARSFCRGMREDATILDYGCGNGAFVRAMAAEKPRARVLGCDYHSAAPPGLDSGSYLSYGELDKVGGGIDLILLRHVLEHTYHPVDLLTDLGELLRPGGVIGIESPNLEAGVRHLFGRDWNGWYVPYHTLHFTRRSLQMVIEGAGLQVASIGGADMPMIGRSLQARRRSDYGPGLMLLGALLQPAQLAIGFVTRSPVNLRARAIRPR